MRHVAAAVAGTAVAAFGAVSGWDPGVAAFLAVAGFVAVEESAAGWAVPVRVAA